MVYLVGSGDHGRLDGLTQATQTSSLKAVCYYTQDEGHRQKPDIFNATSIHIALSAMTVMANAPQIIQAHARRLHELIPNNTIDLIVTSPPYWQCRDYQHAQQIGQENTPEEYVETLVATFNSWRSLLRAHASLIINIGDTFRDGTLLGIPAMLEVAVRKQGWLVANRAVWAKDRGMPEPKQYRLASRYELIYQLTLNKRFYFDLHALKEHLGQTSNPGDVWHISQAPSKSEHLAPFPPELARRAILLTCPEQLCPSCGKPYRRQLEATMELDLSRQQARRAVEIYKNSDLTEEHIAAIRAVGISDAGKGRLTQNGATKNATRTVELAKEAKQVLGGYFREFTFAPKRQVGWNKCTCGVEPGPGTVLDPFMGSGTTLRIAQELGRNAIGADLMPPTT